MTIFIFIFLSTFLFMTYLFDPPHPFPTFLFDLFPSSSFHPYSLSFPFPFPKWTLEGISYDKLFFFFFCFFFFFSLIKSLFKQFSPGKWRIFYFFNLPRKKSFQKTHDNNSRVKNCKHFLS